MQQLYDDWDSAQQIRAKPALVLTAMQALRAQRSDMRMNGFDRIAACRRALEALDKQVRKLFIDWLDGWLTWPPTGVGEVLPPAQIPRHLHLRMRACFLEI